MKTDAVIFDIDGTFSYTEEELGFLSIVNCEFWPHWNSVFV